LAVRAGQAIRAGWATSACHGKLFPKNSRPERGVHAASTSSNQRAQKHSNALVNSHAEAT
jgi:hypothetical protein